MSTLWFAEGQDNSECIGFAVSLLRSNESDRCSTLQLLLLERTLSRRVHELNALLGDPEHRELARDALRCIGFEVNTIN